VNRLMHIHRILLYAMGVILVVTGAGWALLHYIPAALGVDEHVALPAKALLMKVHGAAAMVALLLLGALLPHIAGGWRLAANRASGITLLSVNGLLIVTGYLLYYAGGDALRESSSMLHLLLGAAVAVLLPVHLYA
jgi:hypothetical protein